MIGEVSGMRVLRIGVGALRRLLVMERVLETRGRVPESVRTRVHCLDRGFDILNRNGLLRPWLVHGNRVGRIFLEDRPLREMHMMLRDLVNRRVRTRNRTIGGTGWRRQC